jgi:hypothetical protein
MNSLIASLFSALIAVTPASQQGFTVEQVRDRFQSSGYQTDTPIYWESSQLTTFFAFDDERGLLVLVYRDLESAEQERRAAHTEEEADVGTPLALDDDMGPQLLPGYGRSAWSHNVALVQPTPPVFVTNEVDPPAAIRTSRSRRAELARLHGVDTQFVLVLRSLVGAEAVGSH